MQRKFFSVLLPVSLCVFILILAIKGDAQQMQFESPGNQPGVVRPLNPLTNPNPSVPTACAIQPERQRSGSGLTGLPTPDIGSVTLERFRRSLPTPVGTNQVAAATNSSYVPREEITLIDPTNYGDRYVRDIDGNPANLNPIVVLHETVGSASSAINFFRTPHPRDEDQASYHTLIKLDGTVVYLVPPDKRAFGAGNSVFQGANGPESVKTHPRFPASVNNFAYHISLETPPDGNHNGYTHSGYTPAQYQSLAWVVAKTGVTSDRITTHRLVDRSGQRMDPRSFSFANFFKLLQTYPATSEIAIRCTVPPEAQQS
ncbi:peptidoglycan recognition protein family protein [Leptodesmis sichuanensis]|uniref:peptidoglycan recognition protein family protein n=3 Tax=Leptodesmis TaxID=2664261 RepID=UPI001F357AC2|nr:peptidoglycan recognition family protein [Leptodesmis sichuanensis]